MLPRSRRVPRVLFAHGRGRRLESTHFSVTLSPLPKAHPGDGRATAVVSKKVARRSVDRHLLKRRMLAILMKAYIPGNVTIVYARAGSAALPYRTLAAELTHLLARGSKAA